MTSERREPSLGWRLFLTVWLVYAPFVTTNVVRETYLAIALGEQFSVRVDKYQGLHPDLMEVPGRGWYINGNPGASILAAVPYGLLVRPVIALTTKVAPELAAPKPPATYDDPRPNRTNFMNEARARGLDVVLGMAALGTGVTVMAPAAALATVLMFVFLRARLGDERRALAMSLLFAFATPTLFRAAFLNHNALVAHLVLAAFVVKAGLARRTTDTPPAGWRPAAIVGALSGYALVCDYSAIPFLAVFGCWVLFDGWRRERTSGAVRDGVAYAAGVALAASVLFGYQWLAFGHPFWPAQVYMPPTDLSAQGWMGFTPPTPDRFVRNLLDPRYGVFAFSPLLMLALVSPAVRKRIAFWSPELPELPWIMAAFGALLLFISAQTFTYLQWNTGVRYMVPIVPMLFIATVPVLASLPRAVTWLMAGTSLAISLAVSMMREDVPTSLRLLLTEGPALPVLTVLRKMSSGYDISLPAGTFWIVAAVVAALLALIWLPVRRGWALR